MDVFNTDGMTKESLQFVYEQALTQKLVLEEKMERIKKELSVAITAIEDGAVKDLSTIRVGMTNLFIFVEETHKLIELIGNENPMAKKAIHLDGEMIKEMTLEQIRKKVKEEKRKKIHVID